MILIFSDLGSGNEKQGVLLIIRIKPSEFCDKSILIRGTEASVGEYLEHSGVLILCGAHIHTDQIY